MSVDGVNTSAKGVDISPGAPSKSSPGRNLAAKAQSAKRSYGEFDAFWAVAAAAAYSLDVFLDEAAGSGLLGDQLGEIEAWTPADRGSASDFDLIAAETHDTLRLAQFDTGAVVDGSIPGNAAPSVGAMEHSGLLETAHVGSSAGAQFMGSDDGAEGPAALGLLGAIGGADLSGDVYWRQTKAIVSDGDAVEITGVTGDVVFEGLADLIGLGGSAVEIEAEGSISVLARAAFAGDESAISAQSSGDGDIVVEFTGAAAAGAAGIALAAALTRLEAQIDAVEAALAAAAEARSAAQASAVEEPDDAEAAAAEAEQSADLEAALEETARAVEEGVAAALGSGAAAEGSGLSVTSDDAGPSVAVAETAAVVETSEPDATEAAGEARETDDDQREEHGERDAGSFSAQAHDAGCGGGRNYLSEFSKAIDEAMDSVVDSFVFAPEFVDGAMGQLANASAVGLLANTGKGGVSVIADGVVMASGDAVELHSDEGAVAAEIDAVLVGGRSAFNATGDTVDASLKGSALGGDTAIDIRSWSDAELDLDGVVRSVSGPAVRLASVRGDVDLRVDGEVLSAGSVGVEIEAGEDVRVRVDGKIQGGLAVNGDVDAARIGADGRVDIDIRGELIGGRAVEGGSAAAISVGESFGADVRLSIVGDAWVEAGFVGLERDAAVRLGAGDDRVEIEGKVVGDLVLGDGDDIVRLDKDGEVDGAIIGGRGSDVFHAGDLADLFEMTFGSGSDTVYGFGFGDRFDFRELAEYNDYGQSAMLEISYWDHGEDVATLAYFDGVEHVELTVYGDDLHHTSFDDVFIWV